MTNVPQVSARWKITVRDGHIREITSSYLRPTQLAKGASDNCGDSYFIAGYISSVGYRKNPESR